MLRRDSTTDGRFGLKCSSWARSSLAGSRSLPLDPLVRDPSNETSHLLEPPITLLLRMPVLRQGSALGATFGLNSALPAPVESKRIRHDAGLTQDHDHVLPGLVFHKDASAG